MQLFYVFWMYMILLWPSYKIDFKGMILYVQMELID
jgi:hypothetical protein